MTEKVSFDIGEACDTLNDLAFTARKLDYEGAFELCVAVTLFEEKVLTESRRLATQREARKELAAEH